MLSGLEFRIIMSESKLGGPDETASLGSALIVHVFLAGKAYIFLLVDLQDFFFLI